jgi:hypothetical protein
MPQPEVSSFETIEEELQPAQEEATETTPEVLTVEQPVIEEPKTVEPAKPAKVRTPPPLSPPPKRHPRNTPRFSKSHNGI